MLLARRKDLTPKQTIFSEICLSAAIFLPQTLIFLYICGGGNCSVFREHSVQISISIYTGNLRFAIFAINFFEHFK